MKSQKEGLPDTAPARMVNEFVYCPRLAYIEWIQDEFAVNYEVADGRYRHRVVDHESGEFPENPEEGDVIHARSVWLSALEERLSARIDLIEGVGASVTPVDYKRGDVPDNTERSWLPDRVQLCAQGLVLRANGYKCHSGILYYASSRTRVEIQFSDALIQEVRMAVDGLFEMARRCAIPQPLIGSSKCERCSLVGICLPDEINLLSDQMKDTEADGLRRIIPARTDDFPLYVQEQGARISQSGEAFEVHKGKTKIGEAKIFEISQVSVFGKVQVTTQAVQEMCGRGVPLLFFSSGGWFYGMAHGLTSKNVDLRLKQYKASIDPQVCLALAKAMIASKIENCRTMLMRNHSSLPDSVADELKRLALSAPEASSMESLLGIEGMAARVYFSNFSGMIKAQKNDDKWRFDFQGRNRRPPLDPVNALISFGYSLLAKDLTVTAMAIGFDPFLGLYHQPRYGRPSLALDLMEEFRPIVADSTVLWTMNNGVISPEDFIQRGPAVMLKPAARKKFIDAYERRLDALVTHPVFGYRISYRRVLDVQARLLGRVLGGELGLYPAFRTR